MRRPVTRFSAISAAFAFWCVLTGFVGAQSQGGFLGLALGEVPATAREMGITSGALVQSLAPGGPSEAAGIKVNDIVVAVNSTAIVSPQAAIQMTATFMPGQRVPIDILRWNGYFVRKQTIMVTVGARPASGDLLKSVPTANAEHSPSRSQPSNVQAPHPASSQAQVPPSSPQPSAAPTDVKLTRFTDPLEHSFTIDVPVGWRTEGGLARLSIIQINPYLRALSPDKMIYLMMGEPNLPSYAPPSEIGLKLGYKEGTLYSPGLGQRVLIMHYVPGAEFARIYGLMALGSVCPDLKFVAAKALPDLARTVNAAVPTVIPSRAAGGEALFTCTHNKQEMEAGVQAVTRITNDNVGWAAIGLWGWIAPKNQLDHAREILTHMLQSIAWDPNWIQKQNGLGQQAGQAISQQIAQYERNEAGFMQKLNSVDENFDQVDEIITGNSHYHDPQTGQDYTLNNLNPFKWIDGSGRIVGTTSNAKPPFGYDYRPLTQVH